MNDPMNEETNRIEAADGCAPLVSLHAAQGARIVRLARHALRQVPWTALRYADRERLRRALSPLAADVSLALIALAAASDGPDGTATPTRSRQGGLKEKPDLRRS
jgi:hypothetical protein